MSQQQQARRPQEPIKYGDLFSVEGELAEKPVAPRDAAMMQTAENTLTGHTNKGGAAAIMQSAADKNVRAGFVGHHDITNVADDLGVSATETDFPAGRTVITESVGGQVVGKYDQEETKGSSNGGGGGPVTIGEALEAAVLTAGDKPVERSDAAAIQAAEVRATRRTTIVPGGIAAAAQSAATLNARATTEEEKTTLAQVLSDAKSKLPADKAATRKDAEGVAGAEMRNDPYLTTHPTGVAASVAAAARINQQPNSTMNE